MNSCKKKIIKTTNWQIEIFPFFYPGIYLPYYLPTYLSEFALLLIIGLFQFFCVLLSYINLQRFCVLLTIPIVISIFYFILWQQYVLLIELITNSFCIAIQIFYTLTAFTDSFVWSFSKFLRSFINLVNN